MVVDGLQPQAAARRMSLEIEREGCGGRVTGDREQLAQVFRNLIENAIKYGRAGTKVRLVTRNIEPGSGGARRLGKPGISVSVIDQGDGIAREHLPRLTERFYRVDTARSRELGGTGLGLAIVKHILNRHRAILDIESTIGQGSRFRVFLPLAATPAIGMPAAGSAPERPTEQSSNSDDAAA